jgi:hypothetical protein
VTRDFRNIHSWDIAEFSALFGRVMLCRYCDDRYDGPGALWMWEIGGDWPSLEKRKGSAWMC